jgi:hypothetical protein
MATTRQRDKWVRVDMAITTASEEIKRENGIYQDSA